MTASTTATSAAGVAANTRETLLLTAMRRYAEHGIHAVSLRSISTASGSRNSAAMHYHFKNKLGVIAALVEYISREVGKIALEHPPPAASDEALRSTIKRALLPILELGNRHTWGADAIRFLARLMIEGNAEISEVVNPFFADFYATADKVVAARLPGLPAEIRRLRMMFMAVNVFHGAAEVELLERTPLGDMSHYEGGELLDHLVDYLTGGLTAPSHHRSNP